MGATERPPDVPQESLGKVGSVKEIKVEHKNASVGC